MNTTNDLTMNEIDVTISVNGATIRLFACCDPLRDRRIYVEDKGPPHHCADDGARAYRSVDNAIADLLDEQATVEEVTP